MASTVNHTSATPRATGGGALWQTFMDKKKREQLEEMLYEIRMKGGGASGVTLDAISQLSAVGQLDAAVEAARKELERLDQRSAQEDATKRTFGVDTLQLSMVAREQHGL